MGIVVLAVVIVLFDNLREKRHVLSVLKILVAHWLKTASRDIYILICKLDNLTNKKVKRKSLRGNSTCLGRNQFC